MSRRRDSSPPQTSSNRFLRRLRPLALLALLAGCGPGALEGTSAPREPSSDADRIDTTRQAVAGSTNRLKVALDAPWRVEPGPSSQEPRYGAIPIIVSIYDTAKADEESVFGEEWGRVRRIRVRETDDGAGADHTTEFLPEQFHEIDKYVGPWQWTATPCDPSTFPNVANNLASDAVREWHAACPEVPTDGYLCRLWKGSMDAVCHRDGEDIEPAWVLNTSEWHAVIMYPLWGN